jgi:hypothetical protein
MMRRAGLSLLSAAFAVSFGVVAAAQSRPGGDEERLVRDSRAAIIAQGISGPYFEGHFKVLSVVNAQGDRRVVWRFEVNGHEALVNDTVGYYTDARGRVVDTHSIAGALPSAHDITRTITRRRAGQLMRACIGRFRGGGVVYRAAGTPQRASLVFTASSVPPRASRAEREREERAREARRRKGKNPSQADAIEEGGEGGSPVYLGAIDLETGRCTKGQGIADHPAPERRTRERQ